MAAGRVNAQSSTKAVAVTVPAVQIRSVMFTVGTIDLIASGSISVVKS